MVKGTGGTSEEATSVRTVRVAIVVPVVNRVSFYAGISTRAHGTNAANRSASRRGMDIAVHFRRPLEKMPQVLALPPHELPELQESNLLHFDPAVGFNAPQQVRTTPGSEMVPARGIPEEFKG